jgi:phosphoglycerol transferase MdoB-like AlkP superfamily enzyme
MLVAADTSSTTYLVGWVLGLIIWILVISWTAAIARRKGRSPFLWGVLAFFFSIFALILVALMPSRRT